MSIGHGKADLIGSIIRTVTDLPAAERFYREAMGFEAVGSVEEVSADDAHLLGVAGELVRRLEMALGQQRLTFLSFARPGRPYPPDSTSSDLWFQHCAVVVGHTARAAARVTEAGARPITQGGPQRLPSNTGGVTAFKFRDPFGHPLELLHFPASVGDPSWHGSGDALFRGIDHTAIAVSNLDASASFYSQVLGLEPTERTHNRGDEQSRLDAVSDDDVDVMALTPRHAPPHLELLAYRTGSRRRLGERQPADTAVSRTILWADTTAVTGRLRAFGSTFLRRGRWGNRPAIAFHDPDGHEWICAEPG